MKPSAARVLALLREHPAGITSRDALEEGGGSKLAARIADLKAAGYDIEADLVTVPTRYAPARVARYRLKSPEQLSWTA